VTVAPAGLVASMVWFAPASAVGGLFVTYAMITGSSMTPTVGLRFRSKGPLSVSVRTMIVLVAVS
jgi:hypothetical protein